VNCKACREEDRAMFKERERVGIVKGRKKERKEWTPKEEMAAREEEKMVREGRDVEEGGSRKRERRRERGEGRAS
jgi:hypothetical protein